jgi:N-acetylglutamate synthase-like GNAT family acetyltransferase/SAM-dependent methyltransferase
MRIRAATSADLDTASVLLEKAALPSAGVPDQFEAGFVVAEQGGRQIGVAGIEVYGQDGLLRSVAVDDAYRGQGVGLALVLDRLKWAREQGLRALYLLTTTAPDFFARLGFERITRADAPSHMQRSPEFAGICGSTAITMRLSLASGDDVRAIVRERYASAARAASEGSECSCCGGSKSKPWSPVTSDLYDDAQTSGLPVEALLASLGCGNPTALAQLEPGDVVLDLGSGGGIDVLLSAKRVGPTGKAYGLDMTDEMLALARENQTKAGVSNVEFLKGEIESIPLPDNSVDVIISNCVINLSADKRKVIDEAFRVLKPGGRFAVSDIVVRGEIPAVIRRNAELWTGCVAGALEENEYIQFLNAAGFEAATVEPTRIYGRDDIVGLAEDAGLLLAQDAVATVEGRLMSAFVKAQKPLS